MALYLVIVWFCFGHLKAIDFWIDDDDDKWAW